MREGVVLIVAIPLLAVAVFLLRFFDDDVPIYLQGGERVEEGVTRDANDTLDLYLGMAEPPERAYFVAQFERSPTSAERRRIEMQTNIRFLDAIPSNAYVISIPTIVGRSVFRELARWEPAATAIISIRPTDKLSQDLQAIWRDPADFASVPEHLRRPLGAALADQPYIAVFVRFFGDVPVDQQRDGLQLATDSTWDDRVATSEPVNNVWAVLIPREEITTLVDNPQVQSVEGAPAPVDDDMDDVPPLVDVSANVVETGVGVTVAQWELCQPDISHEDLSGVWIADAIQPQCDINGSDPENGHATMVAGIITGDGVGDLAYTGIAPGARLVSFDTGMFGPISEYPFAMAVGATISTNSWGYLYEYDMYSNVMNEPKKWYPEMSAHYDSVTSGRNAAGSTIGTGEQILVVASSGNEGDKAPWFATRIANSAKNVISVGNVASGPDSAVGKPAKDGGRGPTADGRVSPVLVAPGIEVGDDGGITSTTLNNQYAANYGNSFSTPIVAGAAALLTEKFVQVCSGRDPTPAELRALLVNSALDLTNAEQEATPSILVSPSPHHPDVQQGDTYVGPDNIFGYGLVQIENALDYVESSHFVTNEIEQGFIDYTVFVTSSTPLDGGNLRVTLAWDDPPFSTNGIPSAATGYLQNDLDLVVIDPAGTSHFPWVLDYDHPEKPAQGSTISSEDYFAFGKRDRRNTLEQVSVHVPPAYMNTNQPWTIRVRANTMALGPQQYTLVSGAITPITSCGDIPSVSYPFLPPDSGWQLCLLIIALIMLAILIAILIALMWLHYLPLVGPRPALLRILWVLLLLGLIFYLLLYGMITYLGLLLLALVIYFFFP